MKLGTRLALSDDAKDVGKGVPEELVNALESNFWHPLCLHKEDQGDMRYTDAHEAGHHIAQLLLGSQLVEEPASGRAQKSIRKGTTVKKKKTSPK